MENKSKLERVAFISLYSAIAFTIISAILFLKNQVLFDLDKPIESELFGQFGDFAGGIVGVFVSFASFLLLYENLVEQRRQNKKQNIDVRLQLDEAKNALIQQDLHFAKQIELGKLQQHLSMISNKILQCKISIDSEECSGYEILQRIRKFAYKYMYDNSSLLAWRLFCDNPKNIDNLTWGQVEQLPLNVYDKSFPSRNEIIDTLEQMDWNDRREYLKAYFDSPGNEPERVKKILVAHGSRNFYKVTFDQKSDHYRLMYCELEWRYFGFVDWYIHDLIITSYYVMNSQFEEDFGKYASMQITPHEKILIFYYLSSGKADVDFVSFVKKYDLLKGISLITNMFIDMPSDNEINNEINSILNQYGT